MYPTDEAEQVQYWERQVEYARKRIKPFFDAADVLIKQFNGEASTEREQDASDQDLTAEEHTRRTRSNLVFGWVEQEMSNLLERDPRFLVRPRNKRSQDGARVVSKFTNYLYKDAGQLHQDERCLQDAFLAPYAVWKLGMEIDLDQRLQEMLRPDVDQYIEDPEGEEAFVLGGQTVRVVDDMDHAGHIAYHKATEQAIRSELLLARDREEMEAQLKSVRAHRRLHERFLDRTDLSAHQYVQRERPFAIRWRPDMFVVDPLAEDGLNDARWIAFGWRLPLSEVQANPNYDHVKDLKPTGRAEGAPDLDRQELEDDGLDLVEGWEIWARNFCVEEGKFRDKLVVIAKGHDQFLRDEEEWPYTHLEGYPAEIMSFQSSVTTWFNRPTLVMAGVDTTQALVNEILDKYLYVIRKAKNIWLYDPALIKEEDIENILSAPDCSTFPVEGLSDAKGSAIIPLPFHAVSNDNAQLMQIVQSLMDRSAGTPQPVKLPGTETATEADIHERRTSAREARRAGILAECQVRKAVKMWQLVVQYKPEWVVLVDEKAGEWLELTPEIAKGEYDFDMEVTSYGTAVAMERKQRMDVLNLAAGLMPVMTQIGQGTPNLVELFRRLLVHGFDEHDVDAVILPPQQSQPPGDMLTDPAAQQGGVGSPAQEMLTDPAAQMAEQAVTDGRRRPGIGPVQPDTFEEDVRPSNSRTLGDAQTV